jgi:hypothetical protein
VSSSGGYPIGGNIASLRRNETGTTTPSSFTLFRADAALQRGTGFEMRIGYALTRALSIEAGGSFAQPTLAISITQDSESPSQVLADDRITQYVVDVTALWQISQLNLGRRARPFVSVGGGYLRQLYEDRVKVESGKVFHAGGGVRYWLRGGDGIGAALGVRAEAGAQMRMDGIELAGEKRMFPVVSVFGFFGF